MRLILAAVTALALIGSIAVPMVAVSTTSALAACAGTNTGMPCGANGYVYRSGRTSYCCVNG